MRPTAKTNSMRDYETHNSFGVSAGRWTDGWTDGKEKEAISPANSAYSMERGEEKGGTDNKYTCAFAAGLYKKLRPTSKPSIFLSD